MSCVQERALNPELLTEMLSHAVQCVAFANASQVDLQPRSHEGDGAVGVSPLA